MLEIKRGKNSWANKQRKESKIVFVLVAGHALFLSLTLLEEF